MTMPATTMPPVRATKVNPMKRLFPFIMLAFVILAGCGSAEAPTDDHAGHNHAPGEGHDH